MYEDISILDLKKISGAPLNSNFLGWSVYFSSKDEFLVFCNEDFTLKGWSSSPVNSLKFTTQRESDDVIAKLGIDNDAESVAIFDLDDNIFVACNE